MQEEKQANEILRDLTLKLLELIGIKAGVSVLSGNDADFLIEINVEKQAGLLIGNRGTTLNSIQHILRLIYLRKFGEWKRLIVDVSGWREKEKERLILLARKAAERAKTTGRPQNLYNLSPSQRKIIHTALSQEAGIETRSEGEGKNRYLIITSKP